MIVALTGKKRSGKTTAARVFQEFMYSKHSLAEGIKKAAKSIFLLTDEQLYGNEKEVKIPYLNTTPRKLMQVIGTELFQYDIYKYIPELEEAVPKRELWVRMFQRKYQLYKKEFRTEPKVVIDDLRFKHEEKVLREMGAVIVKIVRPQITHTDTHPSETEIEEIREDHTIINDSSISKFKSKIVDLIYNEKRISL